jgi:beta-lactamase regulating signal transducer with metallopeptidase domain
MNGDTAAAAAWRWAEALGAWAWRASWQGAALAAVVALLLWAVGRRIPPGWRFALWGLVLLRLAMPAIVAVDLGRSEKQVARGDKVIISARSTPPRIALPRDRTPDWEEGEVASIVQADARLAPPAVANGSQLRPIATVIAAWQASRRYVIVAWLAGVFFLGIRIAWSSLRLSRSVRRMPLVADARLSEMLDACCHELGIRHPPLARQLPIGGGAPALVGFRRPTVLLPPHLLAQMPDEELHLILMHELAHVKRRDVLVNWLGTLVAVLHWPNPAAWAVLWRMRAERELACDELVLRWQGGSGEAYARTIVGLVEAMSSAVTSGATGGRVPAGALTVPAGAVGILEGKAQIQRRLLMIAKFDATTGRRWPAVAATVTLLVGALALSGATRAADPPDGSATPATPPAPVTKPKPERTTKTVESKTTVTPVIPSPVGPASDPAAGAPAANGAPTAPGTPGLPGFARPGSIHVGGGTFDPTPASPEDDAANARTAEKLRKPIGKVDFNEVALRDVVDFLRDVTGVDILVQWNAIDEVGVPRDVPITLHLREPMPADGVMTMIFKSASLPLRYEVEKGVVVIGPSAARGAVITRVYDVSDLVAQTLVPPPPGSFPGGGGGGLGGGEGAQPPSPTDVDQLMKLITSTASPETWRDAGGDIGAIAFFKNKLVIKTTEPIHKEVSNLLEMLREKPPTKAKDKAGH